jgi:uncharacterized ion transporter superfamily protein YfcC
MQEKAKVKKKVHVPHTYVILFSMIIIMAILTYVIPAGQYQKVEAPDGRMIVDPNSFANVEANPAKPFDVLKAVPKGLAGAQSIVFFIFIVGGAFNLVNSTGAIEAGISKMALSLKGKEKLMIPLILFVFSVGGGTIGMGEEAIVFVPIGVALSRALGYDAIVGMSMISLGCAVGFTSGFMNPFTVGIAQGIAELPLFSGIGLRLVIWVVSFIMAVLYINKYASKVKMDPQNSIVYELEQNEKNTIIDLSNVKQMTGRHKLVLISFGIGMAFMMFGVFKFGWYITEIAAIFIGIGVVCAVAGGLTMDEMATSFIQGAKDMTMGALVVGLARGILVIMQDSLIIDSIVNGLASVVVMLPKTISAIGMLLIQTCLNLIIPSGSGLAATTMPIMSPLSDVVGITRQTAVLAYQFGDGITNSIIPTSGVLLANLSIAKIKYEEWFKFIWPLMVIWTIFGCIFMVIATLTNYGPF